MNEIIEGRFEGITDPKLQAVGTRVLNTLRLSAAKAVAHSVDPQQHPMPADRGALEHLFLKRFQAKKPAQRQTIIERTKNLRDPSKAGRKLGDLSQVNLRSASAVADQVHAAKLPEALRLDRRALTALVQSPHLVGFGETPEDAASPGLVPQQQVQTLEMLIHKVECVEETDYEAFDATYDTILIGGAGTDETADTRPINAWKVPKEFNTPSEYTYIPPKRFVAFNLNEGGNVWPKYYFAHVALAEEDDGGFSDFLSQLAPKIKELAQQGIESGLGSQIGAELAAAVSALAAWLIDELFSWLIGMGDDDVFETITICRGVRSNAVPSTSPIRGYLTHGRGGTYRVWLNWRLLPNLVPET